jgi:hypothetical protein
VLSLPSAGVQHLLRRIETPLPNISQFPQLAGGCLLGMRRLAFLKLQHFYPLPQDFVSSQLLEIQTAMSTRSVC